jgi:DNA-binding GntR family transcriptional regulator
MTGYRDIADDLRAGIIRGEYAPGETIPTLEDLQNRYRVGKETARRAVATLRAEGLVVPIRRRGTVVRDRTPVRMSVSRYADVLAGHGDLGPWETACARQGLPGRTDLISVTRREADDTLATQMDVPAGTMLVCRLQHMLAGEEVAQIQQTWLPLALAEGTPLAGEGKVVGGIYRMLSRLGHEPAAASEAVTSRMPTREEAETLHLGLGSPVLTVDRATRDRTGAVVVFAQAVLVGDRVQLTYDQVFPRPGEGAR